MIQNEAADAASFLLYKNFLYDVVFGGQIFEIFKKIGGYFCLGIDVGIITCRQIFDIIFREVLTDAVLPRQIHCFVIGDGCLRFTSISTNCIIAVDMQAYAVACFLVFCKDKDPMVAVDNFDIGVAQIVVISIDKTIIPVTHTIIFDSIPVQNRDLHTVVVYIQMSLTF